MSDEGEKTCPLCAEEMDLTDQQLKPCKCGYEICVWCWHHIMDMAEKDETEGRCPACRTPYNKEKIVGTKAKCERLVSEVNVERKLKSQKGKGKTAEGRKQLGSVRVIQRNLVYVVGLPITFADEDLLQRREYFAQYGKVLKVSISRTAAGAIQQFANSTCSVYITYSKEEDAVRCIQSVHGFVLDGRPLRACFGTTKYCHAWLRNVPCTNPDCLYLHEIGSQEDSFTKDEIISAYTRSRVQHITGSSNTIQRRSGNVLPPPADEPCNNSSASSGKPMIKTATNTNNPITTARVSPPNSSSGRSAALPAGASWGTRSSSNQPLPTSMAYSNGPPIQKSETCDGPLSSPSQVSPSQTNTEQRFPPNEEDIICQDTSRMDTVEPIKVESRTEGNSAVSESCFAYEHTSTLPVNKQPLVAPSSKPPSLGTRTTDSVTSTATGSDVKDPADARDGKMENICSEVLSMSIHENQQLQNGYVEHIREPTSSQKSIKDVKTPEAPRIADAHFDFKLKLPTQVKPVDSHELEDDLLSFDNQRIMDPEFATNRIPDPSPASLPKHSFHSPLFGSADGLVSTDLKRQAVDRDSNFTVPKSNFLSRHPNNMLNRAEVSDGEYPNSFKEKRSPLPRYDGEVAGETVNGGENSIISNILSMDFDSWDDSLTSPQNLAKLLGDTDKQTSFGVPGLRKTHNSNQSRFLFAREQEPVSKASDFGKSVDYFEQSFTQRPFGHDFSSGSSVHLEKSAIHNDFPHYSGTESDIFANSHSHISSVKNSVSRSQISAPPGFSVPSRAPPPGFTPQERTEQVLDMFSANHVFEASSLSRNQYQTPSSGNTYNTGDIEFIDPAILAVGKGTLAGGLNNPGLLDTRSNFTPQSSTYEEARFQSFLQRSLTPHQNQRFGDMGDRFSPLGDAYGIQSRVMEHTLANNISPFSQFAHPQPRNGLSSNGQWDGWSEMQGGNNLAMAELLRNERFGFNKFYGGYEDSKIRMPGSSNLYNGAYGI